MLFVSPISRGFLTLLLGTASAGLLAQAPPRALPVEEGAPPPKALPVQPGLTSSPGDDQFDFASLAYERQEWQLAAQYYAKYLQEHPNGRRVADALFRIGECYREQRMLKQAASYWEEVVNRYPSSEGAPSAAYRLGAIAFNNAQNEINNGNKAGAKPGLETAARFFAFCESRSKSPEAKLAALHNKGRCYELLGDSKRHIDALNTLVAVTQNKGGPIRIRQFTGRFAYNFRDARQVTSKREILDYLHQPLHGANVPFGGRRCGFVGFAGS